MKGPGVCISSVLQHALRRAPLPRVTTGGHVLRRFWRPLTAEQSQFSQSALGKQQRLESNHLRGEVVRGAQLVGVHKPVPTLDAVRSGPKAPCRSDTVRSLRPESRRFFSGGAAKPGWVVSKQHRFGPALPDSTYYGEHATYSYFVLFTRELRPYVEKVLRDCWQTVKGAALLFWRPAATFILEHNPEFRLQLVAFASFLGTHAFVTHHFDALYQRMVDVSSLLELQKAQRYATEGFWLSPSEQQDHRLQQHAGHYGELLHVWQEALREATLSRSFGVLVRTLAKPESGQHEVGRLRDQAAVDSEDSSCARRRGIPPPLSWNFSALPYGKDDPNTRAFPTPAHEQPLRAFALSFTSNNLSGDWGDYVDRRDNKNALMRPARMMFTDVLIPPTK